MDGKIEKVIEKITNMTIEKKVIWDKIGEYSSSITLLSGKIEISEIEVMGRFGKFYKIEIYDKYENNICHEIEEEGKMLHGLYFVAKKSYRIEPQSVFEGMLNELENFNNL